MPKIVLVLKGGIIDNLISDTEGIELLVIDQDDVYNNEDDLIKFDLDGEEIEAIAEIMDMELNQDKVNKLFNKAQF